MKRNVAGICIALLGISVLVAACDGGADTGQGAGVVTAVDRATRTVTIEHGDVPGLMKAMTMSFEVADPELLEGVEPGDAIAFELLYADGRYTVIEIEAR